MAKKNNKKNARKNNGNNSNAAKNRVIDVKEQAKLTEKMLEKDVLFEDDDELLFNMMDDIGDNNDALSEEQAENEINSESKSDSKKKSMKKIEEPQSDVVSKCRKVLSEKHKEEEIPKTTMSEDFRNNIVLWAILGVLSIVLVVALVVTNIGGSDDDKKTDDESTKLEETTKTTEEFKNDELSPEGKDSEITKLVKNYLKASQIDVSMDEVSKYVDSTENMSLDRYESTKKYIEEFKNVECYKLGSTADNTFIVVATYGCKFFNIETSAPGCETYIIVNKDGKFLIHNLTTQETLESYISSDIDVTRINKFTKEINDSLKAAIESDDELAKVVTILKEAMNSNNSNNKETTKSTESVGNTNN